MTDMLRAWLMNDHIPIREKDSNQKTADNTINWMFATGRSDFIPKTSEDRRYIAFVREKQEDKS